MKHSVVLRVSLIAMAAWLGATNCVQAAPIFTENFNTYAGIQNATQYQTGLPVAHSGNVTGWSNAGVNAFHAVQRATAPDDWAIMFYNDNVITLTTGIGANDNGVTYQVEFDYGTADYGGGQATTAADGLLVEVLRADNSVLATDTYLPGAWANPTNANLSAGLHGTLQYVGDGSGDVRLRIGPTPPLNTGRFEGEIDNLTVSRSSLSVTVTSPTDGQEFWAGPSISATVTVENGTSPYTVTVYTNSAVAWSTNNTSANLFAIDLGALAEGTYTCYATVTDSASPSPATAASATNRFTVALTDTNAPTPNPMTFAAIPTARDTNSIVMTATTATDALSPPVEYYFENTTNSVNSGWIPGTVWTNTGLTAGTIYGYRVKARDAAVPPHETAFSAVFNAVPAEPTARRRH